MALAEINKVYHISALCGRRRFQQIDGAVLHAENVNGLDCVITFHTDTILQRFMLRFEELKLDCSDHLYIYDGTNAYGNHTADLSCGHNKQNVGLIYTDGQYVTLKYVTDGWIQLGSGFKLVLTAIKRLQGSCGKDFRCKNGFCIDSDLLCDGVNHCNDNSDESSLALCYDDGAVGQVLGMGVNIFIAVVVGIFVVCFVCIVAVVVCICKRNRANGLNQQGNLGSNQSYPMHQHGFSPSAGGHPEKPPPYPGNLYPPAGGIGYNSHQASLYYPTK